MIACFGDYIDDFEHWLFVRRYIDGMPVCRREDCEVRQHPGGAGIVAALLEQHGQVVYRIGDDRPRCEKHRYSLEGRYLYREDLDFTEPAGAEACLWFSEAPECELVLVSDYGKGAVTDATWRACLARFASVPILVDYHNSKPADFFRGATAVKASGGTVHVEDQRTGLAQAAQWRRKAGVTAAIITLGELGAIVATDDGESIVPGFRTVVKDTCGAGDAFLAGLGLAIGRGPDWPAAVEAANELAAQKVKRGRSWPRAPSQTVFPA